ncbi:phosphoribosylpyrophosphate synthetase [Thalassospira sp. MCCC 1A01428]|uniref:phosphoribosylpyrophosphate synthetase n=1 Tax=unclassified Thalassospira TaxID=2648997 RepID=UPI001FEECDCF|nr:phosphoribosylpyrophosphate synthetase [Thalassospira sp. MCCC 1A01428]
MLLRFKSTSHQTKESMMNLSELQDNAVEHGFTHSFVCTESGVKRDGDGPIYPVSDLRIVHSNSVDTGTDPGDDATIYMIEASDGSKGTLIVPAGFYADPAKAKIIDQLLHRH